MPSSPNRSFSRVAPLDSSPNSALLSMYQSSYQSAAPASLEEPLPFNDELLNSDPSPELSLPLPDLDTFFNRLYAYHREGGLWPSLVGRLVVIVTLAFSVLFSCFLLLNVRWATLWECGSHSCEGVQLVTWEALERPTQATFAVAAYLSIFSVYVLWHALSLLYVVKPLLDTRAFYANYLKLGDDVLPLLPWSDVVERLVAVQQRTKLCTFRALTALDITNRIMRKDNFLIALLNVDAIDVRIPIGITRPYQHIADLSSSHKPREEDAVSSSWVWGTLLESIIRLCVLDPLPSADFKLSDAYKGDGAAQALRWRFVWYGVLTLLFLPFLFVFLSILFLLRHAEELHNKRSASSSSSRQWALLSQWKLREYNELPHFFQHRLTLAAVHASDYIQQFPSPVLSLLCGGIAYCAAAVVGILLLMTLSGSALDAQLYDRSLLWWLAVFSGVLAVSRAFVQTPSSASTARSATPTPSLAFARLVTYTHYHPRQWRGLEHTRLVHDAVSSMFQTPVAAFLKEMAALLVCPLVLLFVLPPQSERIVAFVNSHSVEVSGVGVVLDAARFELGGEVEMHREDQDDPHARRKGRRRRGRKEERDEHDALGRDGKLEKSLLSFSVNHSTWKMDGDEEENGHRRSQANRDHGSVGGRERFLRSIAEDVRADEQQPHASRPRKGRRRGSDGSGSRRRVRDGSADSLGSASSNESLSASPSRSDSPSMSPQPLTESNRHLMVSFADLLTDSTRTSRSLVASTLGTSVSMLGSMRGSRTGARARGRMAEEMRDSVGEAMRERMFAVLERRVEEEDEDAQDADVGVEMNERRPRHDDATVRSANTLQLPNGTNGSAHVKVRLGSFRRTRLEMPLSRTPHDHR